jgi:hypothetical protein
LLGVDDRQLDKRLRVKSLGSDCIDPRFSSAVELQNVGPDSSITFPPGKEISKVLAAMEACRSSRFAAMGMATTFPGTLRNRSTLIQIRHPIKPSTVISNILYLNLEKKLLIRSGNLGPIFNNHRDAEQKGAVG